MNNIQKSNWETLAALHDLAYLRHSLERPFTPAEFIDGRNTRTDKNRESHCKTFCKFRKKHKCAKYACRIVNANCDPIAEYMRQTGGKHEQNY